MYISIGVKAFCKVCFTNVIHTSTWPLFWWLYNDVMVWLIFILLQKAFNVLAVKLVPASQTIFFGSQYFAKISLDIFTKLSADNLFTFFTIGNLLW